MTAPAEAVRPKPAAVFAASDWLRKGDRVRTRYGKEAGTVRELSGLWAGVQLDSDDRFERYWWADVDLIEEAAHV